MCTSDKMIKWVLQSCSLCFIINNVQFVTHNFMVPIKWPHRFDYEGCTICIMNNNVWFVTHNLTNVVSIKINTLIMGHLKILCSNGFI